jgi:phosphoglycolate phosphatase-like HAD superfamily hydrolase
MTTPVNGDALTALREALIAKLSDEMDPDGAVAMVRRFEDALIAAGRSAATTESSEAQLVQTMSGEFKWMIEAPAPTFTEEG